MAPIPVTENAKARAERLVAEKGVDPVVNTKLSDLREVAVVEK